MVAETTADIRREIESNQAAVAYNLQQTSKLSTALGKLETAHEARQFISYPDLVKAIHATGGFSFDPPDATAWETAQQTQALTLFPYPTRRLLTQTYRLQQKTTDHQSFNRDDFFSATGLSQQNLFYSVNATLTRLQDQQGRGKALQILYARCLHEIRSP